MFTSMFSAVAGALLAFSTIGEQVTVQLAPPREVVEVRGKVPHPGYVYQRGYYRWDGHAHMWMPGTWVAPPYPGATWTDHRWEHRGRDYVFVEGYWR